MASPNTHTDNTGATSSSVDTPHIAQSPEQQVALIHLTVPRSEIMTAMGPAFAELTAVLKAQNITPTDPWLAHRTQRPTHHLAIDRQKSHHHDPLTDALGKFMIPINILTSTAAPLPLPNIDTDQIIPKQFLKRIERTGYGEFLFFDWRRIQEGPGIPKEQVGQPNPDFVLNKPEYAGAEILLAEKNFGCGSSREHAAWAINQFGFRAVIAPTFADIFYSNAGKNGIILVRLSDADVEILITRSTANPQHRITINLEAQTVTDDFGFHAHFDIDHFRKYCLLNGLDDIGLTLRHQADLDRFESHHNAEFWLSPKGS